MSALDGIRQRVQGARRASLPALQIPTEELENLLAALDAGLGLADKWAALGPADDWAEGGMADTVLADAGRAFRTAVNDALEAGK